MVEEMASATILPLRASVGDVSQGHRVALEGTYKLAKA